jgi:DNA-binding HxlR family transcriptional regulator
MLSAYLLNAGSELFGKKWRVAILFSLTDGPKRFSEIKKDIPDCSVKMLSEALGDMERCKILVRKQYEGIPVKVTYQMNGDMDELNNVLQLYYKALMVYFKSNHNGHNFPPHIIDQLNGDQVSNK